MENLLLASKEKLSSSKARLNVALPQDDNEECTGVIQDDSHTDLKIHATELEDQDRGVTKPTESNNFNPFGHRINLQGDLIDNDLNAEEKHHENH